MKVYCLPSDEAGTSNMWRVYQLLLLLIAVGFADASLAREPVPDLDEPSAQDWSGFDHLIDEAKTAMMGDPALAHARAIEAEKLASNHLPSAARNKALATVYWLQSEALLRLNKVPEAEPAIAKALQLAGQDGVESKLDGDLLLTNGNLAALKGDFGVALKHFQDAFDVFNRVAEPRSQAIALQSIGSIYADARSFDRVLEYYDRASRAFSADPSLELSSANNRATAFQELERYDEALTQYERAFEISKELNSPLLQARILTNIAAVRVLKNQLHLAQDACDRALALLSSESDAAWSQFVWGIEARIALRSGNVTRAVELTTRAFEGVDIDATTTPYKDLHAIAFEVLWAAKNYELARRHHAAFDRLDDQGRDVAASTNLALMGAQFDFASQQLEIAHLKASELEKDVALAQSEATQRAIMLLAVSLIGIGAVIWFTSAYRSARKHAERLRALVHDLNGEIVQRIQTERELVDAKDRAEAANRAKSQFLANMSHELRTPLNAILGFSDMISMEVLGAIGNSTYRDYARDIHRSGAHLLGILSDLLDMARIESGKVALDEAAFDISESLEECLKTCRQQANASQKTLAFRGHEDLLIRADERLLRQAVSSLLSNALKFTPAGGQIELRIENGMGGLGIVVSDTGCGIPPEKLKLILEPFGQVADAFARDQGGIGLGLPIAKAIAELHGGTLSLQSEIDRGTTARIHLPAERVVASDASSSRLAS
jgi:signal transduction histidine kinase